eukprot:jgi/Hompol1/1832/HPOL_000622-RA
MEYGDDITFAQNSTLVKMVRGANAPLIEKTIREHIELEKNGQPHPHTVTDMIIDVSWHLRLVTPQVTFKDYVESVAAERNIPFVPLNRDHPRSGKPLFRLGKKLQVYIDNGVLFVPPATQAASQPASDSRDLDWMFVSVDEAMARALSAK